MDSSATSHSLLFIAEGSCYYPSSARLRVLLRLFSIFVGTDDDYRRLIVYGCEREAKREREKERKRRTRREEKK